MALSKKTVWTVLSLLMLALFLTACAGGSDTSEGDTDEGGSGTGEEAQGGDLILAVLSDASSLDPHGANDVPSSVVQENIFETLVETDENSEIIPGLAESWEAVDELTWSFKLQEGVTFHDGEAFNAEAVKMNLDRIRDEELGSPRANLFAMITNVEAVSEYELEITTEYPFSPLLSHLSHSSGGMISPASIEADYEAIAAGEDPFSVVSRNPVGTGYFKFESWNPGSEIRLTKNEDYWGEGANVDSVAFRVVPDSQVRAADLETGNVHIIDPVQPNEVERIESSGVASVLRTPSSSLAYLGFNVQKEPFDDPLVRRAISYAIDREAIISGIYEDYAIPAIGPLAPGIFGYTDDIDTIEYNMDEAKSLLAEAGMEEGFATTIWTNDNPQRQAIAVLVQEALAELNIEASIEVLEFGAYLDQTAAGEHDMFILGYSNPTGDADYQMYGLFHTEQIGNPGNRSFYSDSEVDELLDEGRRATDPEEREVIYAEVAQLLTDDAPMAFLLHQEYLNGIADTVSGFEIDSAGIYKLKDVSISQ
ncbi:peptide/nickel transport system substrate-binding protein [Planomicrobium stackebrandtii]|uniref:Peptide/nickel transport system substrate-binding protein n=1 Tax=Planomicrobium stackebrandtii TaxID=253160 RepID=A0ABU0GZY5_9BACL|nr:glutathione ABC transporter substrate-binding protein [Planomicrobium stackebrandtii]MDQ0430920.1 peptide/nickel transport system substrate-binding protein [Planomicrobium stackebrandtii]